MANTDARDRATGNDGEDGSNGATGPSEASGVAEVPDDYICPITAEIMTDPVSTMDGFTYERAAITEWLRKDNTSPSTGALLESTTLIPNHLVRSLLRAFTEARTTPSTASPEQLRTAERERRLALKTVSPPPQPTLRPLC
eukprot:scaffold129414_cov63-Phaeocystis_antarctica.AAC.2